MTCSRLTYSTTLYRATRIEKVDDISMNKNQYLFMIFLEISKLTREKEADLRHNIDIRHNPPQRHHNIVSYVMIEIGCGHGFVKTTTKR